MDYRIADTIGAIESSFPQSPDLDDLAKHANISISHLQHLFKYETGKSITQHVKHLRLAKACSLLQNTNLRIKEICYAVGLADCSHFVREFSREYGSSPSKYRKSDRESRLFKQNSLTNHGLSEKTAVIATIK